MSQSGESAEQIAGDTSVGQLQDQLAETERILESVIEERDILRKTTMILLTRLEEGKRMMEDLFRQNNVGAG